MNSAIDSFCIDEHIRNHANNNLELWQLVRQGFSEFVSSKISAKIHQKLQAHNLSDITIPWAWSNVSESAQYFAFFRDHIPIESERVVRDTRDTTIFTTSGVQYLETLLKKWPSCKWYKFSVAQPVIRTQFMESVNNGTATSFVNFSAVSIDSSYQDFISLFNNLLEFVYQHGLDSRDVEINIEEKLDNWGEKSFHKFTVTIYVKGIEIWEAIYMSGYPLGNGDTTTITDIWIGTERMQWSVNTKLGFFPWFERYYQEFNADEVSRIIDCIRSSILIVAEGVMPGNKGAGYRIRRFIKNFTEYNKTLQFDIYDLIEISYNFWENNGFIPRINKSETVKVIISEWERALNMQTLNEIETNGGKRYYIEINQQRESFLKQLSISIPKNLHQFIS